MVAVGHPVEFPHELATQRVELGLAGLLARAGRRLAEASRLLLRRVAIAIGRDLSGRDLSGPGRLLRRRFDSAATGPGATSRSQAEAAADPRRHP